MKKKRNHELPTKDWLSYRNAKELAKIIQDYWLARGKYIKMRVIPVHERDFTSYQVRSNLICGLPPGAVK